MFILHKAIRDGQIQFVEYLMKSGSQIEEKDNFQMTPLHCASQFGRIEIVKSLVLIIHPRAFLISDGFPSPNNFLKDSIASLRIASFFEIGLNTE